MMKKRFCFAAIAAMALASCAEKNADLMVADEMVELQVNVPCQETKVAGTPQNEDKISSLLAYYSQGLL